MSQITSSLFKKILEKILKKNLMCKLPLPYTYFNWITISNWYWQYKWKMHFSILNKTIIFCLVNFFDLLTKIIILVNLQHPQVPLYLTHNNQTKRLFCYWVVLGKYEVGISFFIHISYRTTHILHLTCIFLGNITELFV